MGTTGLEAIDYLLADRYEVPAGRGAYYRERVLRMPDGYVCYDPPGYAPAGVAPAGAGPAAGRPSAASTIRPRSRPRSSKSGRGSCAACRGRGWC